MFGSCVTNINIVESVYEISEKTMRDHVYTFTALDMEYMLCGCSLW